MKRLIVLLLSLALVLTGCTQPVTKPQAPETPEESGGTQGNETVPSFTSFSDPELLTYMEDLVYRETVSELDSEDYFVENVSAVYVSKEYLEELAFNSQSNIYFGCTLEELNELFQGSRYVFTLGEDGTTTVRELQEITTEDAKNTLRLPNCEDGVHFIQLIVKFVREETAPIVVNVIVAVATKQAVKEIIKLLSSETMKTVVRFLIKQALKETLPEKVEDVPILNEVGFNLGAFSGIVSAKE